MKSVAAGRPEGESSRSEQQQEEQRQRQHQRMQEQRQAQRQRLAQGQRQAQQAQRRRRLVALAVASRVTESGAATPESTGGDGGGVGIWGCLEFLGVFFRPLGLGSRTEAESHRASRPAPFTLTSRTLRRRRRTPSPRGTSPVGRRGETRATPARILGNSACAVASLYTMQGQKGVNQDAMVVWENFCSKNDTIFCGVFDGHGPNGHLVSKRVRDLLPIELSADLGETEASISTVTSSTPEEGPTDEDTVTPLGVEDNKQYPGICTALRDSFLRVFHVVDSDLKSHSNITFSSGSTAVTVVKKGRDLMIGNLGDSRAILGTRDEDNQLHAVQLTVDLKPTNPIEAQRIRQCGGRIFSLPGEPQVARVWLPGQDSPGLAMARAFGDFCLKDYGLISMPDVFYRRITEKDEFIVLATDGVWDALSNTEAVNIVSEATSRASAARFLVESANLAWRRRYPSSRIDDCAVVCLFLNTDATSEPSSPANKDLSSTGEVASSSSTALATAGEE